jgi:hypothetical protein
MNILQINIFYFIEAIFLLVILINIASYIYGLYLILSKKRGRTFLRTLKEGWSKKYISLNIVNISLLFSTLSLFYLMVYYGNLMKIISFESGFVLNIYITIYIIFSCIGLVIYAIFVSHKNILRFRDLASALGILSLWNGLDNFFHNIGGGVVLLPVTSVSKFMRQNIIQSQVSEVLVTSILWLIIEYTYKISILLGIIYLHSISK